MAIAKEPRRDSLIQKYSSNRRPPTSKELNYNVRPRTILVHQRDPKAYDASKNTRRHRNAILAFAFHYVVT